MHENASKPLDPPPGAYTCYNIITMARDHFAKFMASPQFNHKCDGSCRPENTKKKKLILKKIFKRIGKK
jgi:hypothetical protein